MVERSDSVLTNPALRNTRRRRPASAPLFLVGAVLILALLTGLVCAWLMLQTVSSYYAHRMYPNVYVAGLKLGRLSPEEAAAVLSGAATTTVSGDSGLLILRDGENHWSIPWSQAGMHLDVGATIQAAFAVGHNGQLNWRQQVREWLGRHDIAPVFSVDPAQARQVLADIAPGLATAPTDATLRLPENPADAVIAVPGLPGRELDIEATLERLLATAAGHGQAGAGDQALDLVFRAVPPAVADVTPVVDEIEAMLARRIELSSYDVLTDRNFSWDLDRDDVVAWLRVVPSPTGPKVGLDVESVQATLSGLAAGLGDGRGFRLAEATRQVMETFQGGGGAVNLYMTHPVRTYIVKPGDSISSIALAFGMTSWHLVQANPGVDPDWLNVDQELTIPSQDELTPYLPVPGKRVVISIEKQHLWAYENGELVFDWPISTGIEESPTHPGVFQVLSKEEEAYASRWDLWMPNFMAVYAAGPNFYNGLHGLPTLSSGVRLWEGLLGRPASYGCIILGLEEGATLYNWAEIGVVVVIE